MSPDELYINLGRQIESQPLMPLQYPIPPAAVRWLARSYAMVVEAGDVIDAANFKSVMDATLAHGTSDGRIAAISGYLERAFALAELSATSAVRGTFIAAGNAFDAMAAVGRVLATATNVVRIVDPYMDEKALEEFAVLAVDKVLVELLADSASVKPALTPAVRRWKAQHTADRPIEARLSTPRALHDRLIIVDATDVWIVSQSLNALAARSPASIVKLDGDAVPLKIAAYEAFWQAGTPIT